MSTPANITELAPDEVFVFGSNIEGLHMGGAARLAHERFGAVWGVGEGLQGQSYAIPTMSGLADMRDAVARFLHFAAYSRGFTFYVTALGTGIAGHSSAEVAPFFKERTPNVELPASFEAVLNG